MYLDAWRKSFTQKLGPDASCVDIAKFAQSHSADQMEGLQKPVRGKLQEIMESTYENGDNDEWSTSISDSPTEPVVDMNWTNSLTGKSYYVQYKNTENINYIERTIQDHPNVPIVVPKGVAEKVNVKGDNAHPFYLWAKKNYGKAAVPKWNFYKIIINKEGKIHTTFSSMTNPSSKKFINALEKLINN